MTCTYVLDNVLVLRAYGASDAAACLCVCCQCDRLPSLDACPAALHAALEAPVTLERSSASEVLLFPLKPSPFFRLLLHGLAQYYGLKSKSE